MYNVKIGGQLYSYLCCVIRERCYTSGILFFLGEKLETTASLGRLPIRRIFHTWWPLAASWLLMTFEIPAISAVIARLPNPEINLAAYGGIVFPVALIIESPIIMLLAASTALSRDWASYQKLFRFMMAAGAIMTLIHVVIAFTPAYYFVARQLINLPENVVEPGRLGLMLITPWTWSIAFRRFQQGVLIRYGHSDAVGIGTVIRLSGGGIVLVTGYLLGSLPGVAVGAIAQAVGVLSEAVYAGIRVRPVVRYEIKSRPPVPALSWRSFAHFYIPLAMTSFLGLMWQPMGSAALSRMPDPLISLAVWPVLSGFVSIFRSFGYALNEVVVALTDEQGAFHSIKNFVFILSSGVTIIKILAWVTPAAFFWFAIISGLPQELANYARNAFMIAIPLGGLTIFQSWFQGTIVNGGKTRAIPEATGIFVGLFVLTAVAGISYGKIAGLYMGMAGFLLANLGQMAWLGFRSRRLLADLRRRDGE